MLDRVLPGIEDLFPTEIRRRGLDYFIEERYSSFRFTPDFISASIHGQSRYATRIGVIRDHRTWRLKLSCSCPYVSQEQRPCKHLFALLLLTVEAIESGRYAKIVGYRPTKVIAQLAVPAVAADAPPPPPAWSSVVRADLQTYEPAEQSRDTRVLRPVRYVVDLDQSRIERGLVLTIRHPLNLNHQRPEHGIKLTHHDVPRMQDAADRSICALLMGAADRQPTGYHYYGQNSTTRLGQWRIMPAMFDTLLPMLSSSGRFFSSPAADQPADPLVLDESRATSPWRLALHLAQDAADPAVHRLQCRFHIGSSSIRLSPNAVIIETKPVLAIDQGVLRFLDMARGRRTFEVLNARTTPPQVRLAEFEQLAKAVSEQNLGVELTWDESFGIRTRTDVEPQKVLSLRAPTKNALQMRLGADLSFHYDGQAVSFESKARTLSHTSPGSTAPDFILRKFDAETAARQRIEQLGFRHADFEPPFTIERDAVSNAVVQLLAEGWIVLGKELAQRKPGAISIKVTSNI
ncbi:MAG: SWIM zinc finger domain-containing protein, partial [Planctomycetota bacterium]|nr:SWIM zinc finger domain-containing protein [Planctomycetota bacterium]